MANVCGGPEKDQGHLSPHLKTVFAWLGAGETVLVEVQPLQFAGPDVKETAIANTRTELNDIRSVGFRWGKVKPNDVRRVSTDVWLSPANLTAGAFTKDAVV